MTGLSPRHAECDDDVHRRWLKAPYDDLADAATECYVNEIRPGRALELREPLQFDADGAFHDMRR